jgi:hypothetical protein
VEKQICGLTKIAMILDLLFVYHLHIWVSLIIVMRIRNQTRERIENGLSAIGLILLAGWVMRKCAYVC